MYSHWTCITKRDLIQKGASYSKLKSNLNIEKVVLNMTLPNRLATVGNSLSTATNQVGSLKLDKRSGKVSPSVASRSESSEGKKTSSSVDKESVLNLSAMSLLAVVSGQRPLLTKARKSIANWKVRKNQVLGFKVTLRGKTVYEFLDKTVRFQNLSDSSHSLLNSRVKPKLPNSEDLGLATSEYSLQSLGNLSLGVKNINLYPELEDLWIAQNLSVMSSGQKGGSFPIGFDLSLNFKNSKELLNVISSLKRMPGGKRLSSIGLKAFPPVSKATPDGSNLVSKTNSHGLSYTEPKLNLSGTLANREHVLTLKHLIVLRQIYLTSVGLFPKA